MLPNSKVTRFAVVSRDFNVINQIALIQLMSHSYLYRRHCRAVCGRADRVNEMETFGHVAREELSAGYGCMH